MAKKYKREITGDEARMVAIKFRGLRISGMVSFHRRTRNQRLHTRQAVKNCSSKKRKMLFSKKTRSVMSILITPRLLLCTR